MSSKSKKFLFHLLAISIVAAGTGFGVETFAATGTSQVATVTQLEGRVQVFVNPSKKLPEKMKLDKGTMAFFAGQYFQIKSAAVGDKLESGTVLRVFPGGQARVIYENGDQFHVGSGSAYRIQWAKNDTQPQVDLMYGRFRGVVEKGGPRAGLKVKTRAMTMGVRGTDFFVADDSSNGETEVSVVRGSVTLQANDSTKEAAKPLEVKTGMTATVIAPPQPAPAAASGPAAEKKAEVPVQTAQVEIRPTTKEDLEGIKKASAISHQQSAVKPAAEIVALEKKAIEVTKKDIQIYQPEVYKKISAELTTVTDVQQLNSKTVEIAKVEAPSAPPKLRKPRIRELKESDEEEVYKKYFKKSE